MWAKRMLVGSLAAQMARRDALRKRALQDRNSEVNTLLNPRTPRTPGRRSLSLPRVETTPLETSTIAVLGLPRVESPPLETPALFVDTEPPSTPQRSEQEGVRDSWSPPSPPGKKIP